MHLATVAAATNKKVTFRCSMVGAFLFAFGLPEQRDL